MVKTSGATTTTKNDISIKAPAAQMVTVEKLHPSISPQSDSTIATISGALPRAASEQEDGRSYRIARGPAPRRDTSLADNNIEFDSRPEDLQQELVGLVAVHDDHEDKQGRRSSTHNCILLSRDVHCNESGKEGLEEESKCDDPDESDFDSSSEDHDSDDDDSGGGGGGGGDDDKEEEADDDNVLDEDDDDDDDDDDHDDDNDDEDDVEHDSDDDDDCSDDYWDDEDTDDGTVFLDHHVIIKSCLRGRSPVLRNNGRSRSYSVPRNLASNKLL